MYKIEVPIKYEAKAKVVVIVKAKNEKEANEIAKNKVTSLSFAKDAIIKEEIDFESLKLLTEEDEFVFKFNDVGYTEADIFAVGRDYASLYGGSCYDYIIRYEDEIIDFLCIEDGEKFAITATYEEFVETLAEINE